MCATILTRPFIVLFERKPRRMTHQKVTDHPPFLLSLFFSLICFFSEVAICAFKRRIPMVGGEESTTNSNRVSWKSK